MRNITTIALLCLSLFACVDRNAEYQRQPVVIEDPIVYPPIIDPAPPLDPLSPADPEPFPRSYVDPVEPDPPQPVPEPGTLFLVASGGALLFTRRRKANRNV